MVQSSVAAAALTLATLSPSFAAGYANRGPADVAPQYSRVVVDSYAGRAAYEQAGHCVIRRHVIGWTAYSRRIVRTTPHYD